MHADFSWLWYAIIVISIISKLLEGRKKTKPETPQQPKKSDDTWEVPSSFEDLLREIEQAKKPKQVEQKPTPTLVLQPSPSYSTPSTEIQNESYELYERAKQEAFMRPSLEESLRLEDTKPKYKQFAEYEEKKQSAYATQIAQDLKEPATIYRSIVLSEILQRKY